MYQLVYGNKVLFYFFFFRLVNLKIAIQVNNDSDDQMVNPENDVLYNLNNCWINPAIKLSKS